MMTALYETDFYQWTMKQAELLREEEFAELDLPNLIEELEAMGRSDKRELSSRLTVIMEHLLKLVYEPGSRAERGWKVTIREQRGQLRNLLKDNATLRATLADYVDDAYADARDLAATGLGCELDDLPVRCPWTVEQVLDLNWLPSA